MKKKQKKAAVNKNIHVGLGRQLKEAEAIMAEEDVPIECSPPCTQELPEENFLEAVLLATLCVRKCHGCKGKIIRKIASHPKICSSHAASLIMEGESTKYSLVPKYRNICFHLTISCVQKHNNKMTIEDITIAADTLTLLTPENLCFLHQKWLLELIVAKLQ